MSNKPGPSRPTSMIADEPSSPSLLDLLISHINSRFHQRHRRELPELVMLARRIETASGGEPGSPQGVADILEHLKSELEPHMEREEMVLFPAMQRGSRDDIEQPAYQMLADHDRQDQAIRRIEELMQRAIAADIVSWRMLQRRLESFCRDLRENIWLENDILLSVFGRSVAHGLA